MFQANEQSVRGVVATDIVTQTDRQTDAEAITFGFDHPFGQSRPDSPYMNVWVN